MEIAVPAGTVVSIAHDERLTQPAWLTKQFQPTDVTLTVNGKPMQVFQHTAARNESLTLGSNNEATPTRANMYVVLVKSAASAAGDVKTQEKSAQHQ
jgi:beta-galactosidase